MRTRARRRRRPPSDVDLVRIELSADPVEDGTSGAVPTRIVARRPRRPLFAAIGVVGLLAFGLSRCSDPASHLPRTHLGPTRPPVALEMVTPPHPATTAEAAPPTPPTTTRPAVPPRPSPGCTRPPGSPAPRTDMTVSSRGEQRSYIRTIPDGDERVPAPVVVVLDDGTGDPGAFLDRSGWAATAQSRHLVLAAPRWTREDDDQFAADAIVDVGLTTCVDLGRVYLAGFATGATLGSRVVCDHPGLVAAFVAVAGLPAPERCPTGEHVAVLGVQGAADETVSATSVGEAIEAWARQDGCRPGPSSSMAGWNIQFYEFQGCSDAVSVQLFLLDDMGHEWPVPVGDASTATRWADLIDATALAMAFCETYAR